MKEIVKKLFELSEAQGEFKDADAILNLTCEKQLSPYKEGLQDVGYEQIRDIVYSVSYFSKQSAFEIGFKSAIKLMMECMQRD